MKINDIVLESKSINEAPVGMLKRAGMGLAAKLGSHTAAGGLETAKLANNLKNAYSKYLGKSRQKPNSDNILAFLKSNGLPTDAAEKEVQQAAASAGVQLKPAKDMKQTLGIGKKTDGPMATPNPSLPPEKGGNAEVDLSIPTYRRQGKSEPELAPFDAEKSKQSNVKAKLKSGGGIAKQTGKGFGKAVAAGRAKGLNMSQEHNGNPVMEVDLKSSTIDKIILAAVADAEKLNMGQELDAAIAGGGGSAPGGGDQQSGGGGVVSKFFQGVKKGVTGQDSQSDQDSGGATLKGNVNFGQLQQMLPGVDAKAMATVISRLKQGKEPSVQQMAQLGSAFVALLKADAQTKQAALNILKKMQAG